MMGKENKADPEALRLAELVQEAVKPDTVILSGSRARGDHRSESDMDLMPVVRTLCNEMMGNLPGRHGLSS